MTDQPVDFRISGAVARITLNRPDANAIDLEMARSLMDAAMCCDHDPAVRAVLLTGSGRFFCTGGDLKAMAGFGDALPSKLKEMTVHLHAAVSHLMRMRAPLLVAVNGPAAGAGFSLAIIGDIVLAARSATFTMAYTAAGLVPDGSATWTLPRLIGVRRAQELMLTNRRLSTTEAEAWRLVTRVVDDDRLAGDAEATVAKLAAGPTMAFGCVKRLLATSFDNGLEAQMEAEGRGIADMAMTQDGREGIGAFLDKRKPDFRGT